MQGTSLTTFIRQTPISVDQFFTMTGIRFMDDMTCPRRSTVHASQLQRREFNDSEST